MKYGFLTQTLKKTLNLIYQTKTKNQKLNLKSPQFNWIGTIDLDFVKRQFQDNHQIDGASTENPLKTKEPIKINQNLNPT